MRVTFFSAILITLLFSLMSGGISLAENAGVGGTIAFNADQKSRIAGIEESVETNQNNIADNAADIADLQASSPSGGTDCFTVVPTSCEEHGWLADDVGIVSKSRNLIYYSRMEIYSEFETRNVSCPVNLPHNAEVTDVIVYYHDNRQAVGDSMTVSLWGRSYVDPAPNFPPSYKMATLKTPILLLDGDGIVSTDVITQGVINNMTDIYSLQATLTRGPDLYTWLIGFRGAKICYEY